MNDPNHRLSVNFLLGRVAAARRQGNVRLAADEWNACIARAKPRVESVVDYWVHRKLVASADRDDIVQAALIRGGRRLLENLDALEERAFMKAMATCAEYTCMDHGRKHKRKLQREVSADAVATTGDGDAIDRYDYFFSSVAEDVWARGAEIREAEERLDKAISKLTNERQKKLLVLQRLGHSDEIIAELLGVTVTNLYQIRSRTLRELRGLIDS